VYLTLRRTFAIFVLLMALPLMAQMPQPFSADMTTVHPNGPKLTGKLYFSPPRIRMDMTSTGEQHGPFSGNMSMIVDSTAQTTYMLMPQAKMYMEFHANNASSMNTGMRNLQNLTQRGTCPEGTTCKKAGAEVVNGRSCDKYENTDKSGRSSTVWIDQKLHFPIRVQDADGATTDFTNVKEGAQDPSLFQLPAGYRQFDPRAVGGRPQ